MKSCGDSTTACVPKVLVASLLRAMAPTRLLEAIDNVPVTTLLEPVERERRARHVAQHVLEALAPAATCCTSSNHVLGVLDSLRSLCALEIRLELAHHELRPARFVGALEKRGKVRA